MKNCWTCTTAIVCFVALVSGCNSGGPSVKTVDVSGVVTLDDRPLADADVNFVNEETGFGGYGRTDSEGKFTLVQGAAPGQNKVYFSKKEVPEGYDEDPESGLDDGQLAAAGIDEVAGGIGEKYGEQMPLQYTMKGSKLTFMVPEGGTSEADFKLQSD